MFCITLRETGRHTDRTSAASGLRSQLARISGFLVYGDLTPEEGGVRGSRYLPKASLSQPVSEKCEKKCACGNKKRSNSEFENNMHVGEVLLQRLGRAEKQPI